MGVVACSLFRGLEKDETGACMGTEGSGSMSPGGVWGEAPTPEAEA